ncbi:MAG: hypothetical protein KJ737_08280 [Proteobacteria bacterium]|nr:hypothetical protein [Pseudomonadota bacterium]
MQIQGFTQSQIQTYTHQTLSKDTGFPSGASESGKKTSLPGTLHIKNVYTAKKIMSDYDIEQMSPREMTQMSQALHIAGIISQQDYQMLSFQPELHQDYNRAILAEKGIEAKPDEQRNYIEIWKNKVNTYENEGAIRDTFHASQMLNILENLTVIKSL